MPGGQDLINPDFGHGIFATVAGIEKPDSAKSGQHVGMLSRRVMDR